MSMTPANESVRNRLSKLSILSTSSKHWGRGRIGDGVVAVAVVLVKLLVSMQLNDLFLGITSKRCRAVRCRQLRACKASISGISRRRATDEEWEEKDNEQASSSRTFHDAFDWLRGRFGSENLDRVKDDCVCARAPLFLLASSSNCSS
jgi:hypothetical protein